MITFFLEYHDDDGIILVVMTIARSVKLSLLISDNDAGERAKWLDQQFSLAQAIIIFKVPKISGVSLLFLNAIANHAER